MTDIRPLKSKVLNGDDPVRTLILSLPDDISREDLVSKMDVILKILDDKKER
jgi:hypothetical protein